MKKFIYLSIVIIIIIWVTVRIFSIGNSATILSNEAAFDIHLNTDSLNVDKYFSLPEGTFDIEKHVILCKLPVESSGTKPNYLEVKLSTNNINCKEEYKPQLYLKFNNTELNDKDSKLLIVNKFGGQVLEKERQTLMFLNEERYANNIIAEQDVELTYQKGKVNHLVISLFGVSEFCK